MVLILPGSALAVAVLPVAMVRVALLPRRFSLSNCSGHAHVENLHRSRALTRKLEGLMSQWIMPLLCACAKPSAACRI